MAEIRVPALGESVTEATIGRWFKQAGQSVAADEPVVELETDKVTIEVPAPASGVLAEVSAKDGETVAVGALLGQIKEVAGATATGSPNAKTDKVQPINAGPEEPKPRAETKSAAAGQKEAAPPKPGAERPLAPSVRKLAAESGVDA